MMSKTGILWIGSAEREFATIAEALHEQSHFRIAPSVCSVDGTVPELVILAYSYPGQHSPIAVGHLREQWSRAGFLCALGEWCCGEKRTCQEFDVMPTVYAHEIRTDTDASRLKLIARRLGEPRTVSTGGMGGAVPKATAGSLVAVYSASKSFRQGLAEGLSAFGLKTVTFGLTDGVSTSGVDAVVWEAAEDLEIRNHELQQLQRRHSGAQLIALLTYPRERDFQQLGQLGVCVVAQPFRMADLLRLIPKPTRNIAVSAA